MEKPILCVGALTLDTIFRLERLPERPGKVLPLEAVTVAEGMAAAQAASIVRLGGSAALWASAGDDAAGDTLVADIAAAGVDTSLVRRAAGARSGFSTILMDTAGSTIIVPQYDAALAAPPAALPDFSRFAAVMCDVRWPAAAELALGAARDGGIPGILDADVGPEPVLARLAGLASHIVASEGAARILVGADGGAEAAAAGLAARFGAFAAVTAGERGVWWSEAGEVRHSPSVPVAAIDTLAAGDVFHAAFAVGLVEGRAMPEVLRFASVAAAIKCTRFGGRLGCPTRAEVEAFAGVE
jgi:sulfofructose kinase